MTKIFEVISWVSCKAICQRWVYVTVSICHTIVITSPMTRIWVLYLGECNWDFVSGIIHRIWVWIPAGEIDFSFLQNGQNGFGAHPFSYSTGIGVISQWLGHEFDHFWLSSGKVKNEWNDKAICLYSFRNGWIYFLIYRMNVNKVFPGYTVWFLKPGHQCNVKVSCISVLITLFHIAMDSLRKFFLFNAFQTD
jgi:hypothetical protein